MGRKGANPLDVSLKRARRVLKGRRLTTYSCISRQLAEEEHVAEATTGWGFSPGGSRPSRVPDLVDQVEIASRLYVSLAWVVRMRKLRILPTPDLRFEGHDLWLWDQLETWARLPGRTLQEVPRQTRLPTIDLVSQADIARRMQVKLRMVAYWQQTRYFPIPNYRFTFGDAWLWDTIERWTRTNSLAPSREAIKQRNRAFSIKTLS